MRIASTAIIFPNVDLGENVVIEDFCIIGAPVSSDHPVKTVIGKNSIIRSHTTIYAGNRIGENFSSGNKTNIREFNDIGCNVSIGTLSVVEHHVKIHNNVRIHSQAFIPEFSILEENCWIGPNVVLTNAKYPQNHLTKEKLRGPIIRRETVIGANSTILPGIIIGERNLIGAGAVVTKNTQDNSIYTGNPAKYLKSIKDIKDYELYSSM